MNYGSRWPAGRQSGGPAVTVPPRPAPTHRPRAERLAQWHAIRAFTALVRVGAIVPVSPEPGVYAWAAARTDPRVRDIATRAATDIILGGAA
jgi:hypothetical protein